MKCKFINLFWSILFIFCLGSISLLPAQSLLGTWRTVDDATQKDKSVVKIYKAKNGKIYGKIEKILDLRKGENPLCETCPGDRQNKPLVGMLIIRDMIEKNNQLKGGKILDPENGKEYSCKIWLEGKNLKVRGYWGPFYRTQTWLPAKL